MVINLLLIIVVLLGAGFLIARNLMKKQNQKAEEQVHVDDKTYTLEVMTAFVKKRLDEITKFFLFPRLFFI